MIPTKFNQGIGRFSDKCPHGLVQKSFVACQLVAIALLRRGTGLNRFSGTLCDVFGRSGSTRLPPGVHHGARNKHLGRWEDRREDDCEPEKEADQKHHALSSHEPLSESLRNLIVVDPVSCCR